MKCPHCNQYHPDDTRFCPQTGKHIQKFLNCPNPECVNYDKYDLPSDTYFCPDCGTPIQGVPSGDDISINGIVLGQTTLRELRQKGFEIGHDDDVYRIATDDDSVKIFLFYATYREVEKYGSSLLDPSVLNRDFILNKQKRVSVIEFDSFDNVVFKSLGVSDDCEEEEIIEILEERGYMQIENLFDEDGVITFVRERKDSAGNTIFLLIRNNEDTTFYANLVIEWKSYKTGEIFYAE